MLFNSDAFLKFFAAFLLLYYLARNHLTARNVLIVAASYLFYGWWVPAGTDHAFTSSLLNALWRYRFLGLLVASSLLDYSVGLGLERIPHPGQRKLLLAASITGQLGLLGVFKYYDFFVPSVAAAFARWHLPFNPHTLGIILPVGISFYTFQTMSYAIDVYRRQLPATRNLLNFLAYVSFFPKLVAGPIERARELLPQFAQTRVITRAMIEEGLWLILWGMFKKVVLADNLAPLVDMVYQNTVFTGAGVLLATLAFAFQIYGDFSGYSDIARGTARLLGFDLMANFNAPYAATSVREFWRRWHISLSTWLRDYLYVSLGGNRDGLARTFRNIFLTMLLGGLWHGAAWNFALWGAWHGAGLMVQRAWNLKFRLPDSAPGKLLSWLATLLFVLYGWLLFRAHSLEQIISMTRALKTFSPPPWIANYILNLLVFTLPLVAVEIWQFKAGDPLAPLRLRGWRRAALLGVLLLAILLYWTAEKTPFIYFQF